jgi:streptogramin lyase
MSKSLILVMAAILCILVLAQGVQAAETYYYVSQWGTYGTENGNFTNPHGIAVDSSGNVYVSEPGIARIQKFNSGHVFVTNWGYINDPLSPYYYMQAPTGVAVDSSGNVYDGESSDTARIMIFTSDGLFIDDWTTPGGIPGTRPNGVAVGSSGYVYAVSYSDDSILKYNPVGFLFWQYGTFGTGDREFHSPQGIAVDSSGYVYVADTGNNRIQKFTPDGTYLTQWGSAGTGDGLFNSPQGIAVDSSGYVYVVDTGNNRIQTFYPTLTVTSITPNSGINTNSALDVEIGGTNFISPFVYPAHVDVSSGEFSYIPVTNVNVVNSNLITCTLDLTGTLPGSTWDVHVTNPDYQYAVLYDAFTITSLVPIITPDQAVDEVIATVLSNTVPPETALQVGNTYVDPGTDVTLLDGTSITNPLTKSAWLVFIDDGKNDNWFHPCRYVFVSDDGRSAPIAAMSPPADASAFSYSNKGHIPNPAGIISSKFPPAADPACFPDATNNYALLISGGIDEDHNYIRYYNDIAFLYKTLVKDYKYDKSRIKVLMSDGSANTANDLVASYTTANPPAPVYGNSNTDLDGDGSPETWDPATRSNVLSALGSYSTLGTSANLFIFTTSHGASNTNNADPNTNDVDLYLWGTGAEGKISDTDFVNALPLNPKISMTMEQCNGGGFKDEFIPTSGTKTKILATAARGDKVSKSNDFSYYWITGVAGHDSLGYQANADTTNINGQVSMKEAFDYANYLDPSASLEIPQFFDYAGGAGADQYFSACSATPPGITVTTPSSAWTMAGRYTVTWSRTGTWPSPTPYVKVLLMKGAEPGLEQATISSSKLSSAGSTGASYLVPACLNGGPGSDYWIKIITNGITPPISGQSSTFSITGVSTCAKTTLWIKSLPDPASLGATIDIKDSQGTALPGTYLTNHQYTSVSPGTYYIKLAKTCFYNMLSPQSHTVIAGIPSTRTITLTPLPVLPGGTTCDNSLTGSIAVYSIPDEGYHVYIRSTAVPGFTDKGSNTPMIEEIGQGDYIVRLEADGYHGQEKPVTVTAGQQASVTFELERLSGWSEFSGFYEPIKMGIMNSARAGSAIPVIWHLSDANGNDVSNPASFSDLVSYRVDCPDSRIMSASSDGTKVYPGSSGLQYLKNGNWQINWKTLKNYAGTCRNMYVEFNSGQKSPEVLFSFKK